MYQEQHENKINGLIVMCCAKDLIKIKETICDKYIKKLDAATLIFLLEGYEDCKIQNTKAREFKGQTTVDTKKVDRVLYNLLN